MIYFALANSGGGQVTGIIETNNLDLGLPTDQICLNITNNPNVTDIRVNPRSYIITRDMHGNYIIYKQN